MTVKYRVNGKDMDIGSMVFALLMALAMLGTLFVKPQVSFLHHVVVIDSGIIFFALFFGALFWGIIEAFTPAGKNIYDLLWRIILGFILGLLIGGFLAYYYSLGQYLIVPAYYGNLGALFFLLAGVVVYLVFLYDAAWMHSRSFMKPVRS